MRHILSIGSNIGNKESNLKEAINYIEDINGINIEKTSSL